MLNFQFNLYQFRLTSHLSFIGWGSHCLFWQDYQNVRTVEVCFLFLSIHICESSCFSPTLTLCLLLEWGSWCSRAGLSCVIAPVPLCWKCVCSQLQFPLPTDLPIDFLQSAKPPSLPLVLMHLGGSIPHIYQQTPVCNWDSSWSLCYRPTSNPFPALLLPVHFVQVISQSLLLPCLFSLPIKLALLLLCSISWI